MSEHDDVPTFKTESVVLSTPSSRWEKVTLILAMLVALVALGTMFVLLIHDGEQADNAAAQAERVAVAAERVSKAQGDRIDELSARLVAAELALSCRAELAATAAKANAEADRAELEVVIETAEQFHIVLSGGGPGHTEIAPQELQEKIDAARVAIDAAAEANAVYVAAVANCAPPPED